MQSSLKDQQLDLPSSIFHFDELEVKLCVFGENQLISNASD